MLSYILNKQIDGQKIISDIQDLVSKEVDQNSKDYVLIIQIKKVSYTTNELVPKITYEPL